MNLDRVTMTGADDSVSPVEVYSLSKEFPFVEWGILISETSEGHPRFPSRDWISRFMHINEASKTPMLLSLHVCGFWTREFLLGRVQLPPFMLERKGFQRIQLNFHAERTKCDPMACASTLGHFDRQVIFQIDGASGNKHMQDINQIGGVDCVPLFDISGGAGVVPSEWPKPMMLDGDSAPRYCGYAGGLGPQNIAEQLPLIAQAAGDCRVWIDMETHVRSDNDKKFDLQKVRHVLEFCADKIKR